MLRDKIDKKNSIKKRIKKTIIKRMRTKFNIEIKWNKKIRDEIEEKNQLKKIKIK
jgi:hypothetical protein